LEQVWQRRPGGAFVVVVTPCEGDGSAVLLAETGDGRRQNARRLRADEQQSFLVRLGRHDLQHRHDLAGVGQLVGDQRQMGQLGEFFDPNSVVAQCFHDRPRPERLVFGVGEVDRLAGGQVLHEHRGCHASVFGSLVGAGGDAPESA
jgi:hypothetical protein